MQQLVRKEKYSTGSCVLPFLKKMEKDLEYKEDDPVFISKFKTELWSDLEKRCLENLNQRLLAKAAFFDKRFSNLKFLEEEEKKAVLDRGQAEKEPRISIPVPAVPVSELLAGKSQRICNSLN